MSASELLRLPPMPNPARRRLVKDRMPSGLAAVALEATCQECVKRLALCILLILQWVQWGHWQPLAPYSLGQLWETEQCNLCQLWAPFAAHV